MMFPSLSFVLPRALGIDLGPHVIKVALVEARARGFKALRLLEKQVDYAADEDHVVAMVSALKELLATEDLKADHCSCSLPADSAIVRVLSVPVRGRKKVDQTIKFQMEPHIPYPIGRVVVDHSLVQQDENSTTVMTIAFPKDLIQERLALFEEANILPDTLDVDSFALIHVLNNPEDFPPDKTTALLYLGSGTFLAILQGGRPIFFRYLGELSVAPGADQDEWVSEVQRSLLSFATNRRDLTVERILVAGVSDHAVDPGAVAESLGVPVSFIRWKGEGVILPEATTSPGEIGSWAGAVGLAIRAATGASLNFRKEEFQFTRERSWVKPAFVAGLLGILVAATSLGHFYVRLHLKGEQKAAMDRQIAQIMAQTFNDASVPYGREVAYMEQKLQQQRKLFDVLRRYSDLFPHPLDVLREVSTGLPPGSDLKVRSLDVRGLVLNIDGEVTDRDSVEAFKKRLDASELFVDARINDSRINEKTKKIDFRISAKVVPPA